MLYGVSRTVMWVVISSAIIGLMPYNLESTRQEMLDAQKAQEKSVCLSTGSVGICKTHRPRLLTQYEAVNHLMDHSTPLLELS